MKPTKSNRINQIGSAIVEALITVTFIGIGSLGLINLQGNLIHSKANANQSAEAMQIAKAKIEELRNYSTISGYNAISSSSDSYNGVNATYSRTWTATQNTNPDYTVIDLTVTWPKQDSSTGTINIRSHIAKLNPVLSGKAMDDSSNTTPLAP